MGFYLPGIYKPFYIEGLLVHSQAEYNYDNDESNRNDTLFALIDVHNGIGIYDAEKNIYNVGDVSCIFNFYNYVSTANGGLPRSNKISVYREKPLFASSYQDTISSIFYKVDVSNFTISSAEWQFRFPYSIQVKYTSPVSYNTVVNRNINIGFNVHEDSGIYNRTSASYELLYLKRDSSVTNYWNIANNEYLEEMGYLVDGTFIDYVYSATTNNVAYYVVNEAFYKYFIKPETHLPGETSLFYRTYNNGENEAFKSKDGDRIRNFCDLFPYKIKYNNSNPTYNFKFDKNDYDKSKNCCYTKPFLRMFPALNNKLNNSPNTDEPGCCRIVYENGTIKFEGNNQFVMSSSNATDPKDVNFYLICVKSPLTNNRILGNANAYDSAITKGGFLNPEQDYITYIRNYGRIKLI